MVEFVDLWWIFTHFCVNNTRFMNSKAAFFFLVLLIVQLMFAILLFLVSRIHHRKELSYMYMALFLKAVLSLGPALLMFNIDISWSAFLTGTLKVTFIPLTYLYLKKLSSRNKSLTKSDLWHFLPMALSIVLTLIFVPGHANEIAGQSNETLKSTMKMVWENSLHHNVLAISCRIMSFGQAIVYSFLVFKLYQKYLGIIKNNDSLISYYNGIWIKWVVVIMLLQGFFEGFALLGIYKLNFMLILGFPFQIIYAFFFVIHATIQKDLAPIFESYTKEPFTLNSLETQNLIDQFKAKKLFLIPDISLDETARQLDISKYKFTQVIKDAGYDNFYCFINEQRIETSKILLSKIPENFVIESIIEQSGFKSRSTFYRVFKQITGNTPSEFISMLGSK